MLYIYCDKYRITKWQVITSIGKKMKTLESSYAAGGDKIVQLLWKSLWEFFKTLIRITTRPSNSIPKYIPKRNENIFLQMFTALFITVKHKTKQKLEQFICPPITEWRNKMWYVHTMKYYSAIATEGMKY